MTGRVRSRCGTYTVTVNIICEGLLFCCWPYLACEAARGEEGKARKEGGGHDGEVASSKED